MTKNAPVNPSSSAITAKMKSVCFSGRKLSWDCEPCPIPRRGHPAARNKHRPKEKKRDKMLRPEARCKEHPAPNSRQHEARSEIGLPQNQKNKYRGKYERRDDTRPFAELRLFLGNETGEKNDERHLGDFHPLVLEKP